MRAPREHHHFHVAQRPRDQLAGVPDRRRRRPSRNIRVRRLQAILQGVRKRTQPAAEHHSDGVHSNIPAMHADMKLAMVPAATAFMPSLATSDFREGASAPIPPTWIATELRLAKPHSA